MSSLLSAAADTNAFRWYLLNLPVGSQCPVDITFQTEMTSPATSGPPQIQSVWVTFNVNRCNFLGKHLRQQTGMTRKWWDTGGRCVGQLFNPANIYSNRLTIRIHLITIVRITWEGISGEFRQSKSHPSLPNIQYLSVQSFCSICHHLAVIMLSPIWPAVWVYCWRRYMMSIEISTPHCSSTSVDT